MRKILLVLSSILCLSSFSYATDFYVGVDSALSQADATHNGFLSSTDWVTFNSAAGGGKAASGANTDITSLGAITKLFPSADSTTAIQFDKHDASTVILDLDTTNKRVGINTTSPASALDVKGNTNEIGLHVKSTTNNGTGLLGGVFEGANDNDSGIDLKNTGSPGSEFMFRANHSGIFEIIDVSAGQTDAFWAASSGNMAVGPGSSAPQATLDIRGTVRLNVKYAAGSPPVSCDATHDGLMFLSSTYHLCVCKGGSTSYVLTSDGSTACS